MEVLAVALRAKVYIVSREVGYTCMNERKKKKKSIVTTSNLDKEARDES